MIQEVIVFILGIISGIITGLLPGIHNNLITTLLVTSGLIYKFSTKLGIIYIVSLSVTNTFTDIIPSIYLFCQSPDTAIISTPGQKMVAEGNGHIAINNTIKGSIIAIIAFLIILFPLILILQFYDKIEIMFPWLLSWIIILSVYRTENKIETIIIILLSGVLGFFVLNSTVNQPLLPLLTGFFGTADLITTKTDKIPHQELTEEKITLKESFQILIKTLIISPLCSLLPGLGTSQASMLGNFKKQEPKQSMILIGSINTLVLCTSFITLYSINKSRSGAAAAISQLTFLTKSDLLTIIITILITAIVSAKVTNLLSKKISKKINKINFQVLKFSILIFVSILTIAVSGVQGTIIYITSILIGILTIKLNVTKSSMMSCILLSTIIYYLP